VQPPPAEATIDIALVRALLQEQHSDLATLPLVDAGEGWDNRTFRLGEHLAVRLPRSAASAPLIEHQQRWLPILAPDLPLPGCLAFILRDHAKANRRIRRAHSKDMRRMYRNSRNAMLSLSGYEEQVSSSMGRDPGFAMRAYTTRLTVVPTTVTTAVSSRLDLKMEATTRPAGTATPKPTTTAAAQALQS
jgi:hypothetical protein